ncbi:hypothetical protein R3X28_11645 [Maribacter sp. TH_r10]|uniref:hypothetical protein n=1 Tax=Maribacter sp. TH_r10 TaxID=3082086 RepID=UPI0029537924|nr:hypothetical protein [Maribacter sp. TH_r10]MDV7139536.1 hypothetical protein [Maribacter sp. TH_r10]
MKNLIFVIMLVLSSHTYAQSASETTNIYLRVFDMQGKKIGKGKMLSMLKTSLILSRNGEPVEIPVSNIGSIKTKRSGGNNMLIGASVGAGAMAIVGAATADPDAALFAYNAGEGAAIGTLFGGTVGAMVGGVTTLFKKSKSYEINGNQEKWKAFSEIIIND